MLKWLTVLLESIKFLCSIATLKIISSFHLNCMHCSYYYTTILSQYTNITSLCQLIAILCSYHVLSPFTCSLVPRLLFSVLFCGGGKKVWWISIGTFVLLNLWILGVVNKRWLLLPKTISSHAKCQWHFTMLQKGLW